MSFCDFVPSHPDCQKVEETTTTDPVVDETQKPVEIEKDPFITDTVDDKGPVNGGEEKFEDVTEEDLDQAIRQQSALLFTEPYDPFSGQLSYFLTAFFSAASIGLNRFKYDPWSNYDTDTIKLVQGGTNWYLTALYASEMLGLAFWSTAMVTQFLAMLGIMPGLNFMIWWQVGGFYSFVVVMTDFLKLYAYEQTFNTVSTDATNQADAESFLATLDSEAIKAALFHIGVTLALYNDNRNWQYAYWSTLDDAGKQQYLTGEKPEEQAEPVEEDAAVEV